jgi:hypothetical protein
VPLSAPSRSRLCAGAPRSRAVPRGRARSCSSQRQRGSRSSIGQPEQERQPHRTLDASPHGATFLPLWRKAPPYRSGFGSLLKFLSQLAFNLGLHGCQNWVRPGRPGRATARPTKCVPDSVWVDCPATAMAPSTSQRPGPGSSPIVPHDQNGGLGGYLRSTFPTTPISLGSVTAATRGSPTQRNAAAASSSRDTT